MHVHWIDQYRFGTSPVHQLDARVKLLVTIAYILVASLTPVGAWPAYGLLFALVLGATLVTGLGLLLVQRRALVALPFALAALTVLFATEGTTLFTLPIGSWRLTATVPGLIRFLSIVLKSWLSVQMAILLAGTTSFPDLMAAMRSLRFPPILVAIVSFMWRYIFVLADEAMRLRRARDARSAVLPEQSPVHSTAFRDADAKLGKGFKSGGTIPWRARVVGGMAGNLFLRSYERSERIYQAMLARGYRGELRTLTPAHLDPRDVWVGVAVTVYLTAVLVAGVLLW
jgi:cobalt/nickel transport system permease protein